MVSAASQDTAAAEGLAARTVALELLEATLDSRRTLDEAGATAKGLAALPDQDRAFALALAGESLRRLGSLDHIIDAFLDKPLPRRAGRIRHCLRLGLCQALFMSVADHAAADTTVRLARRIRGGAAYAGLVNAILRRAMRQRADLLAAADARPERNIPRWLRTRWIAAYGEDRVRAIARAHLARPPLDLTLKDPSTVDRWAGYPDAAIMPTASLRLSGADRVEELPGFADGAWWVQDMAAALPARLFGDVAGRAVVDLCAAPGGKTLQLAAAGAAVTAVDRSGDRLDRLAENLKRTGLAAETVPADALDWTPAGPADYVLLDAPCLATGTARRHPDALWVKTADMLAGLTELQGRLLDRAADMVRPGGFLVYCVCSLEPEEGPDQIARFLQRHADFAPVPVTADEIGGLADLVDGAGCLRTLPCHLAAEGGMDGFFAARLRRGG